MPTTTSWLTVDQAAERLNVVPKTVRRLIDRGELPAYRVRSTRVLRIKAADVDGLLTRVPAAGQ